jgi:hypothetical protein
VLVVDEAAMLGTRKLAPLLGHAHHAGAKVILVGDDRQFASIDAGGGFRALRVRLGASELTVNRRQVEAWEQQAIDDVRDGRVEQAIAAYAEHERIRAFEGRDDRDRAVVADWWAAHQAGEEPVVYAHRRAQVDRLNTICQRLRAQHGELGPERLAVGDHTFAVGDQVVLGANALDRLGVANGTSAEITGLDVQQRTMTVRTLEEEVRRTVTLPGWYLDATVRPGQSRRVDLAYARTDMRSQGRTEQRALLALDGKEDMQGFYVQLTRGKDRTDLYLTVGPEPLNDQDGHGHPRSEPVEPARLLGRVMTRDGSKTLASDTPVQVDVRRWSTRRLRAERDQLATLRRDCPPDRSRELRLARQRAADVDQARRAAQAEREAVRTGLAAAGGGMWRRRRPVAAARQRLWLAEHGVRTVARQAGQAAERAGVLRRAEQARAGWFEQHADLPAREGLVARELAWRRRVDARAVALDPPGWLLAELGPVPPAGQAAGRAAWIQAAVELDSWRRAHGLDDPGPAKHVGGQRARPERAAAPATPARTGGPPPAAARRRRAARPGPAPRAHTAAAGVPTLAPPRPGRRAGRAARRPGTRRDGHRVAGRRAGPAPARPAPRLAAGPRRAGTPGRPPRPHPRPRPAQPPAP